MSLIQKSWTENVIGILCSNVGYQKKKQINALELFRENSFQMEFYVHLSQNPDSKKGLKYYQTHKDSKILPPVYLVLGIITGR
jgi:hypothetical protein